MARTLGLSNGVRIIFSTDDVECSHTSNWVSPYERMKLDTCLMISTKIDPKWIIQLIVSAGMKELSEEDKYKLLTMD